MTTQTPRPGEIWRHYKGEKHCSVLGVSSPCHPVDLRDLTRIYNTVLTGVGEGKPICIWRNLDTGELRHLHHAQFGNPPVVDGPLVVYACSGGLWVRPLAEFCEKFTLVVFEAPR
jgi:hypothetical protein